MIYVCVMSSNSSLRWDKRCFREYLPLRLAIQFILNILPHWLNEIYLKILTIVLILYRLSYSNVHHNFICLYFLGNPPEASAGIITATADAGFVSMIRTGMLALQLLPPNSAAGLVVVTGKFFFIVVKQFKFLLLVL